MVALHAHICFLQALGHKRVSVVNGGLAKWLVEGMPVADGAEDKNIIRVSLLNLTRSTLNYSCLNFKKMETKGVFSI